MRCFEVQNGVLIPGVDFRGLELAVGVWSGPRIPNGVNGRRKEIVSFHDLEDGGRPEIGADGRVHWAGLSFRALSDRANRFLPENGFQAGLREAQSERECGRILVHVTFRNRQVSWIEAVRGRISDGEVRGDWPIEADVEIIARGWETLPGGHTCSEYVLLLKQGCAVRLHVSERVSLLSNENGELKVIDD